MCELRQCRDSSFCLRLHSGNEATLQHQDWCRGSFGWKEPGLCQTHSKRTKRTGWQVESLKARSCVLVWAEGHLREGGGGGGVDRTLDWKTWKTLPKSLFWGVMAEQNAQANMNIDVKLRY